MPKYRKKPVVIEAWKWEGGTLGDAERFWNEVHGGTYGFCSSGFRYGQINGATGIIIPTLEGDHVLEAGNYLIRGVKGELYPCRADIFKATYEAVDAG